MTTLTIHVPDSKARLIKRLLKELDVIVEVKEYKPNNDTVEAMNELKSGKGKVFKTAKDLFTSI